MKRIVVIEAQGKVEAVSTCVKRLGLAAEVIATHGHFCNSPADISRAYIDSNFRETRRACKKSVVESLRKHCARAEVLIATDADDEGEVIARDVFRWIADIAAVIIRVRARAITPESYRQALSEAERWTKPEDAEQAAIKGDARRLMDRLLAVAASRSAGVAIGRVGGGLLAAVSKDADPVVALARPVIEGPGGNMAALVPVRQSELSVWQKRCAQPIRAGSVKTQEAAELALPGNFSLIESAAFCLSRRKRGNTHD